MWVKYASQICKSNMQVSCSIYACEINAQVKHASWACKLIIKHAS